MSGTASFDMNRAVCIQNCISVCTDFSKGAFHVNAIRGVNIVHINIEVTANLFFHRSAIANKNVIKQIYCTITRSNSIAIIAGYISCKS